METVACAICGRHQSVPLLTKWGFTIARCAACDLSYVNPRDIVPETDEYFRGPYLETIEEGGELKPGIEYLYSDVLRQLNTYLHRGRLLDVGCAMGHFMEFARRDGWRSYGVECSGFAAEYGRQRWGLRIQAACDLAAARLPSCHFDACVLIEVVEHLPHPQRVAAEIFRALRPGGILYATTPNFGSFRSLLERENWGPVIPTGHLYYFTYASLSRLLSKAGFHRIVNLTPPAEFDEELARSRMALGPSGVLPPVEEIRRQSAAEDSGRLINGRHDALIVAAIKPLDNSDRPPASMKYSGPLPDLEGRLISSPGNSPEDGKVYMIHRGLKHWVTNAAWFDRTGLRIEDTVQIPAEMKAAFLTGSPLE